MIGYVTLGTDDLDAHALFYDQLLAELGAKRLMEFENGIAWGTSMDEPGLCLVRPFNGQPATVGNGVMVALNVQTPERVDTLYHKALSLGATSEGPAGPRGDEFYAGYFRDPAGNKLNVFCVVQAPA